jgi:tetratricopeptide (TPR) repeat protein
MAADRADLARQAREVLNRHCYRCHGQNGVSEGGLNYVVDLKKLVDRNKVVPGDPARSRIFKRLVSTDNPMPPEEEKVRPGREEVAVIQQWIKAGASGEATEASPRPFLSPAKVAETIRTDLRSVPERDRPFTRYFTLTHLHNSGLSSDELQTYRHGLSKLVNSLSWGRRVVVPRAIDPEKTVFRIDLRDYQWNEKIWEAIVRRNPYGVALDTEAARYCADATHCPLPVIRGDWFVATASRPPLYHEVLQLPDTEQALEKMLRVDVAEDIRQERVARAGFNGSGVSRNNRLIERHESGRVVYWKSYDFGSNTGRQNLFARPLGPDHDSDETTFQHDGGEIIFNLPNGLQAYMLADGKGKRIDKGPTAIVSDPKRPDRAVENGLSCMSCHARGLIDKADQVREHVLKNESAFNKAEVESVRALYPTGEAMARLMREDARRFQEAVEKTGAPLSVTEPVAALAVRFEAELDLALAAAEAGVVPGDFRKALSRSPALAKPLGTLLLAGGTVQRTVFVESFPDLVHELRLGEYLEPTNRGISRHLREGALLIEKGDLAAAIRAFDAALAADPNSARAHLERGDAFRLHGDLGRAIEDYTQALKLEPASAIALNNRGLAYDAKGEDDRALADFASALRLNPRLAAAHLNRGALQHRRGDTERAIADYSAAIRLEPRLTVAFNNRGLAYFDRKTCSVRWPISTRPCDSIRSWRAAGTIAGWFAAGWGTSTPRSAISPRRFACNRSSPGRFSTAASCTRRRAIRVRRTPIAARRCDWIRRWKRNSRYCPGWGGSSNRPRRIAPEPSFFRISSTVRSRAPWRSRCSSGNSVPCTASSWLSCEQPTPSKRSGNISSVSERSNNSEASPHSVSVWCVGSGSVCERFQVRNSDERILSSIQRPSR